MTVDARARAGLFLAMQYPVEVPGVSVSNFLRTAKTAVAGEAPKLRHWVKDVRTAMEQLAMDPAFAERDLNAGFSGGEKKRHEILQLELLDPKVAVLDETDSGLDIDALRVVREGVNRFTRTATRASCSSPTTRGSCATSSRTSSTSSSTAGSPRRAGRSWPSGWRPRATRRTRRHGAAQEAERDARRRTAPRRLPDPGPHRPRREAAGVPRLRRHVAEAAPVLDAERAFYETSNAALHRGAHQLAEEATDAYEGAPAPQSRASSAPHEGEVVFTKNATEAINLVAYAMSNATFVAAAAERFRLGPGDEIVVTEMEHHANLVPWQELLPSAPERRCAGSASPTTGGSTSAGSTTSSPSARGSSRSPRSPTCSARSTRSTGRRPAPTRSARSSARRLPVGAAAAGRRAALGVDFLAFSGHKMLGPTGIGVLWGRRELLEALPPFLGRRVDDRDRPHGGLDLRRRRRSASKPARPRPRRRSGSARRSTTSRGSAAAAAWTRCARTSTSSSAYALDALTTVPGCGCSGRPRPSARRARSFDGRGHPPARRRAGARRPGDRRAGRAPLRVAAAPPVRRTRLHARLALRLQRPRRHRRARRRHRVGAALLRGDVAVSDPASRCTRRSSSTTTKHPHRRGPGGAVRRRRRTTSTRRAATS